MSMPHCQTQNSLVWRVFGWVLVACLGSGCSSWEKKLISHIIYNVPGPPVLQHATSKPRIGIGMQLKVTHYLSLFSLHNDYTSLVDSPYHVHKLQAQYYQSMVHTWRKQQTMSCCLSATMDYNTHQQLQFWILFTIVERPSKQANASSITTTGNNLLAERRGYSTHTESYHPTKPHLIWLCTYHAVL